MEVHHPVTLLQIWLRRNHSSVCEKELAGAEHMGKREIFTPEQKQIGIHAGCKSSLAFQLEDVRGIGRRERENLLDWMPAVNTGDNLLQQRTWAVDRSIGREGQAGWVSTMLEVEL